MVEPIDRLVWNHGQFFRPLQQLFRLSEHLIPTREIIAFSDTNQGAVCART